MIHNINNPLLFRCEYRSPDKFLARNVRFKVEIIIDSNGQNGNASASTSSTSSASSASTQSSAVLTNNININNQAKKTETTTLTQTRFKILFTLINGSTKQFHQLCKHIRTLISMNYSNINNQSRQQRNAQQKAQTTNVYTPSFQANRTYQRSTVSNTPNMSSSMQNQVQQSPVLNQRINQAIINLNTPTSTTSGITTHHQPLSYQASPSQVSSRRNSNTIQTPQTGSPSINSVIGNLVSSIQISNDNTNKNSYINQSSLGSSLNSASHLINSYVPVAQNTPVNQNLTALLLSSSSGSSSSSSGTNTTTTPIQINGPNKSRKNSNTSLSNSPLINSHPNSQFQYQSANPIQQNGNKKFNNLKL